MQINIEIDVNGSTDNKDMHVICMNTSNISNGKKKK